MKTTLTTVLLLMPAILHLYDQDWGMAAAYAISMGTLVILILANTNTIRKERKRVTVNKAALAGIMNHVGIEVPDEDLKRATAILWQAITNEDEDSE